MSAPVSFSVFQPQNLGPSLESSLEQSPVHSQMEGLVGDFVEQATDWRSLAAMTAGGMTYRLGRMGAMAAGTGRLASLGIGLGAEVTAFEMTHRSFSSLTGDTRSNTNLWRWDGQGGILQGLLSSLITFGSLKGAGRLAQGENIVVQHLLQDTGMVLGHQVSGAFGIIPRPTGSLAEQFFHAEATNLQLGAGMVLAQHLVPGVHALERRLDLSLQSQIPPTPLLQRGAREDFAMVTAGISGASSREPFRVPQVFMMEGRKPASGRGGAKGGRRGKARTPVETSMPPQDPVERFHPFFPLLRTGITQLEDLPLAFRFLEELGGPWRQMVETMDRLRQERMDRNETGAMGEAFAIRVPGHGTSCSRQGQDRRTELADGISLDVGQSIFGLIHELTHALPIDELPPELARVPYFELSDLRDLRPTFEETYFHLLNHMYQDESISMLAEISLYRDLKSAGIAVDEHISEWEARELRETLEIYEQEGLIGYLQSERYIGRNHWSSYNAGRALELAFLAAFDPQILSDSTVHSVLEEHGLRVKDPSPLLPQLTRVREVMENPTPDRILSFLETMGSRGLRLEVDLPTMMAQVREAIALAQGTRRKASHSFLGRAEQTVLQVGLLAEVRRRFESYGSEFEAAFQRVGGDFTEMKWTDTEGLLAFYRMAALSNRGGRLVEMARHLLEIEFENNTPEFKEGFDDPILFSEGILLLEWARLRRSPEDFTLFWEKYLPHMQYETSLDDEGGPYKNYSLRTLTHALWDPWVRNRLTEDSFSRLPRDFPSLPSLETEIPEDPILTEEFYTKRQRMDPAALEEFLLVLATFKSNFLVRYFSDYTLMSYEKWAIPVMQVGEFLGTVNFQRSDNFEITGLIRYQRFLRKLRSENLMPETSSLQIDLRSYTHFYPALFWLGEPIEGTPGTIRLYPRISTPFLPQAVFAKGAEFLLPLHFFLERGERRSEDLTKKMWENVEQNLTSFVDIFLKGTRIETELENETFSPEGLWIATRLACRWAELGSRRGKEDWTSNLLKEMEWILLQPTEGSRHLSTVMACREEIEMVRRLLPFFQAKNLESRRAALVPLIQEYETTVRLRRQGMRPHHIANFLRRSLSSPGEGLALRAEATRMLELAIGHTAVLDVRSEAFRFGVRSLMAAIDEAPFTHIEKDRLMAELFRRVLPDRQGVNPFAMIPFRRRWESFEWLQNTLLSEETLNHLGLYPQAEAIVLGRTREILHELSSIPLPVEIQGRILSVAVNLERYFQRVHPELTQEENAERLGRLSSDPHYQVALADVFPSRTALVDPRLPPARWNPVLVRRGLPERASAWERIRRELEEWLEGHREEEEEQLLEVFQAFHLHEIEASGKPTDVFREIQDLSRGIQERRAMGQAVTPLRTGLSIYASVHRILSRHEKVLFDQLTQIPSVAWVLERTERAISEDRPLTPREIRLWNTLLRAPTVSDAQRKRELFLLVLNEERFSLDFRRLGALGLAQASQRTGVLESLIEGYRSNQDVPGEARLYHLLSEYWKRVGQFPGELDLLWMEEEGRGDPEAFGRNFDRVFTNGKAKPSETIPSFDIEIRALRHGRYSEQFLKDMEKFLVVANPKRMSSAFQDEFHHWLPNSVQERRALLPILAGARKRRAARQDRLNLIRMNLPAAFNRQTPEIRFLLGSFLRNRGEGHGQSFLTELQAMDGDRSDAEVFRHFFLRCGLEKAGQFLSTMVGWIPEADRKIFAELQDRVPPSSPAEVRSTAERELGRTLHEVFSEWDEVPVASASMGEVYRARLLSDHSEVFVKVITPSKRANIRTAIATLRRVAEDYEAHRDRFSTPFDVLGAIRRFADQLQGQLNFAQERRQASISEGVRFPEFDYDLSTESMNVMAPASGIKITALTSPESRRRAAERYAEEALTILFIEGYYHADPHPGNVFWDDKARVLTWLDWGVVGRISREGREGLIHLLFQTALGSSEMQVKALEEVLERSGSEELRGIGEELQERPLQGTVSERLLQLLHLAGRARLVLRPNTMGAIAYLLTIQGVVRELDPAFDFDSRVAAAFGEFYRRVPSS